jgi:RNA polymerase sigma factor (sigma-70 family)
MLMSQSVSHVAVAIHRLLDAPQAEEDRELLHRFAQKRDEEAFAELVLRHGPLVRGACRRLLCDPATAEDVFQATFLVLARKAGASGWRATIGPWLYAVAVRLCRKARAKPPEGVPVDQQSLAMIPAKSPAPAAPLEWEEMKGALDEELSRLSASLREPLVLCYLQGRTRDEAARQLGVSLAKLKRRLERARNLLHARLTRRGITLAGAGLGVAITAEPLSAGVAEQTSRAALSFVQSGATTPAILALVRGTVGLPVSRWALVALLVFCLGAGLCAAVLLPRGTPSSQPLSDSGKKLATAPVPPEAPVDPLPEGAVARFGSPRLQHFSIDRSATFSPDGKLLATSGANTPICVWDVKTGKLVRTHPNRGSVYDLRWQKDGKLAAVTFFNHDVFLMQGFDGDNPPNAEEQKRIEEEARNSERRPQPGGKTDYLNYVRLSPDGRLAIAIWNDREKPLQRISVYRFVSGVSSNTAKAERTVEISAGNGAWVSNDGKVLVAHSSATKDQPERLLAFDLAKKNGGKPTWEFNLPGGEQRKLDWCFSPEGKRVVLLFWDDSVELWDGTTGKRVRELPKLPKYYHHSNGEWRGIDLSADGNRLALVSRTPTGEMGGRIVDVDTGKDICTLRPQPLPRIGGMPRFSVDGKRVAQVSYGVVRIWNAEDGSDSCPLPGHRGLVNSLAFSAGEKTIISAGEDQTVRAWSPATGKEMWRTSFPQFVKVKFTVPGGVFVQDNRWGADDPVQFLDAATGKRLPLPGALAEAKKAVFLALAPDSKSVISVELRKRAFHVWSWPKGELLKTVPLTPPGKFTFSRCSDCAFTPHGKQFVAVMQYADPARQQELRQVPDHPFLERWDLAAGKLLERRDAGETFSPILIPAGNRLLLQEKNVIRDAASGKEVVKLSFGEGQTRDLSWSAGAALSPDQKTLVVNEGFNGGVLLFDMPSGRYRGTLTGEGRSVGRFLFLPDGRLVTAGETALVWRFEQR